jgi:Kdo2-lipid IVA lauroyltransferase/acyltransferase
VDVSFLNLPAEVRANGLQAKRGEVSGEKYINNLLIKIDLISICYMEAAMNPKQFLLRHLNLNLSKFFQMRLNSWLIRFLPFFISRYYLITLGRLYYFFNRKEKHLIENTIAFVLERSLSNAELHRTMRETFKGIFDHYHEKLYLAYAPLKRVRKFFAKKMSFEGEAALQQALALGKGAILATGHFGAVEFLPAALAFQGYKVAMICRFQTSRLRDSLVEKAKQVNLEVIDSDKGNCLLAALKALKQGRIIITEADEFDEWKAKDNRQISFLGAQLEYDRALDVLSKRSGSPVVSALVSRSGKGYTLRLTPVASQEPTPFKVGEKSLEILEEMCKQRPTQWYQWKKFGKMIRPQLEAALPQLHATAAPMGLPYQYA